MTAAPFDFPPSPCRRVVTPSEWAALLETALTVTGGDRVRAERAVAYGHRTEEQR